jgi:Big-like domain-containing protein
MRRDGGTLRTGGRTTVATLALIAALGVSTAASAASAGGELPPGPSTVSGGAADPNLEAAPSAALAPSATTTTTAGTPSCAATFTVTTPTPPDSTSAAPGPCWTDVTPYPFGADGNPVDPTSGLCAPTTAGDPPNCYLTVTSMAFRAWNRGLAATSLAVSGTSSGTNAFGVWLFNGTRWFPDPAFPGSSVCKGTVVLWAGKLDYWLIGPGQTGSYWPSLCRFDGANFAWEPIAVPAATIDRGPLQEFTDPTTGVQTLKPSNGAITSGACYSWDDCWFFGTNGSIDHWDGTRLADASPDPSLASLDTGFTAAVARSDLGGNPFGAAVGGTGGPAGLPNSPPLPAQADGTPPPQLYGSSGGAFAPVPFAPTTAALPGDPYRTDLVALDFGPDRQGWVAGNPAGTAPPAGVAPTGVRPRPRSDPAYDATAPAPLLTTTPAGTGSTCSAPPADRFTYSAAADGSTDSFLWSSISVIPGTDDALAGGEIWAPPTGGPDPDEDGASEPVIVDARCDGTTTTTRFPIPDPTFTFGDGVSSGATAASVAPADHQGYVTAIAANAVNDAWAATTGGVFTLPDSTDSVHERPHLYRLTDGQPPAAQAGDDDETRPLNLQFDPPPTPLPPPPPAPAPAPAPPVVAQTPTRDPLPTVYAVSSKIHHGKGLSIYLTFRLRRPVTLGAQALFRGRVISTAPLHHFTGKSGRLVLPVDVKHFPTALRFTGDTPKVTLANPGERLSGTVTLRATATPYKGRRIDSVSFEYSRSGKGLWSTIATATAAPWTASFATAALTPGRYDLRAIATDDARVSGVSAVLGKRTVARPAAS